MNDIELVDYQFGPAARNLTADATSPSRTGALAALETFYHALNNRDLAVPSAVWSPDQLAQLNNPVGGILGPDRPSSTSTSGSSPEGSV